MKLESVIVDLVEYVKTTDYKYQINYPPNALTYPIPFFGNIESAKILTVGVNPSNGEFSSDRDWPVKMAPEELLNRLINYFNLKSPAPHPWFQKLKGSSLCLTILARQY